jgi:microcystin-dependent protein
MSGTTSLCLQQQFHNTTGEPLVGGLLYSRVAGTLTPQNAFRTAALTVGSEYPNPVVLDAAARVPLMFYTDGLIRLILTDKNGVAQFDYDNVPIIGSSGGGGAVDTTDPTRLYSTGFMMLRYGIGAITGYVRCNARTIGSAVSGATELADASAQALFQFLWSNDPSLAVLPSRGASAVADWTANKQIATPDFRGVTIAGADGMGNTLTSRITNVFGGAAATLGALGGQDTFTLAVNNLPIHGHPINLPGQSMSGSASVTVPDHTHGTGEVAGGVGYQAAFGATVPRISGGGSTGGSNYGPGGIPASGSASVSGTISGNTDNTGSGNAVANMQPTRLVTVYMRL